MRSTCPLCTIDCDKLNDLLNATKIQKSNREALYKQKYEVK